MRRILILLCYVMLMLVAAGGYALEEDEATPLPPDLKFGLGDTNVEIRPVKERLKELGYYDGQINYEMDNDAMYALKSFCQDNALDYSAYGITKSAYYALISQRSFTSIATPSPIPEDVIIYETIPFGTVSEAVLDIQIRLKELGYYDNLQLTPNTYDWDFQAAIDRFCKENHIAMMNMEVTPSLQKILYSDIVFAHAPQETPRIQSTATPVKPEGYRFVLGESSIEIRRLQDRLALLGYYKQEDYGYELNMDTLYAFNLFCYENRIHYSEQGITEETWNLIMGEEELISLTPLPTQVPVEIAEYVMIEEGVGGEPVSRLQLRLIELGYAENAQLQLGVYDDQFKETVRLFCDYNHIAYGSEGISAEIQRAVFSENAAMYSAEVYNPGLVEKVRNYLLGSYTVLGISVAGYVIALVGVGIFAAVILLIVMLITGKQKNETHESGSASLQGISRPHTEVSIFPENQMKLIDFNIRYQGKEHKERLRFGEQLQIGRSGECDLILSSDDKGVSRCHCVLLLRAGNIVLSDVSVNGTFVNDKRYHKAECVIHSGDRVQIGRHLLVIKF